jgi:anti-sigma factor RsiW
VKCEIAFERMLEADPEELSPESATELGAHIAGCERCRAVAQEILAGQRLLGDAVKEFEAEGQVDTALHGVRAAARARRRWRMASVALLPLAAAAVLVLLVTGDRGRNTPTPTASRADLPSRPTVTLPPTTNAMVLQTENPKISVVWFY